MYGFLWRELACANKHNLGLKRHRRTRNICKGIVIDIFEVCLHQRRKIGNYFFKLTVKLDFNPVHFCFYKSRSTANLANPVCNSFFKWNEMDWTFLLGLLLLPEGKHWVLAAFLCKQCTSRESSFFFFIKRRKAVLTKRMQYCDLAALSVFFHFS